MSRARVLMRTLAALITLACSAVLAFAAFAPGAGLAEEQEMVYGHAQDGSATYYSFVDAWAAALSGTKVVMDTDWYTHDMLTIGEGKNVSIMMNGHRIWRTGNVADNGVLELGKRATLTLDGTGAVSKTSVRYAARGDEKWLTTGGVVTGGYSKGDAGGIVMQEGSTLNLVNAAVAGNKAADCTGGGVSICGDGCTINMTDAIIAYNMADTGSFFYGRGGGVYINGENATINMTRSSISSNEADLGGGVYSTASGTTIMMYEGSSISLNNATDAHSRFGQLGHGAGVYFSYSYLTIGGDGTGVMEDNQGEGDGGAIYVCSRSAGANHGSISGVAFINNTCSEDGGAIYLDQENITIANCSFTSNGTSSYGYTDNGGAIYINNDNNTVRDCTFTANQAEKAGGAIYNNTDGTLIQNCTITGNVAGNEGGGIWTSSYNDVKLSGTVIVNGNTRGDGKPDDVFLNSITGDTTKAFLKGDVDAGSCVGIRTASEGERVVVKDLSSYIEGTFFLDQGTSYHLSYSASDKQLSQVKGAVQYTLSLNGSSLGSFSQGETLTIKAHDYGDNKVFLCWEPASSTGLWNVQDIMSNTENPTIKFEMPSLNVNLVATFADAVYLKTVRIDVPALEPGQAFPSEATLVYTNPDGTSATVKAPVTWDELRDDSSMVPAQGNVKFSATYGATVNVPRNLDAGLVFWPDMGIDDVDLRVGDAKEGTCLHAWVDSDSGELTATSEMVTTRDMRLASIEDLAVSVPVGATADDLVAAMPTTATGLAEDDSEVTLALQDASGLDWTALGVLAADGKVAEPDGASATFTATLAAESCSDASLVIPESLRTATVTLTVKHSDLTVTFDAAEGAPAPVAQTVTYGTCAQKPADPALTGYAFLGWFAEGATSAWDFSKPLTSSLVLTAKWENITYEVTFSPDNGQDAFVRTAIRGECVSKPEDPTFVGHAFLGWFADGADQAWDFGTPVTGPFTLTAKWELVTLTVSFDAAGGSSEPDMQSVKYGSCAQEPADPSYGGRAFLGWYADGADEAWDFTTPVTQSFVLTARWEAAVPLAFFDVPEGAWFHDWVYQACDLGLMTGYRDGVGALTGYFGPGDALTRGQVATVLWRISGSPDADDSRALRYFPDVPTGYWCSQAVYWCAERGIVTGYRAGEHKGCFRPDEPVTREELAVMVYRFEREVGVRTDSVPSANFDRCLDTDEVSDWAVEAMRWCAAAGVLTGFEEQADDGTLAYRLAPGESTMRSQAAKVLYFAWYIRWHIAEDPYEPVEDSQASVQVGLDAGADVAEAGEAATYDDVTFADVAGEQAEGEGQASDADGADQQAEGAQGAEGSAAVAGEQVVAGGQAASDLGDASAVGAPAEFDSLADAGFQVQEDLSSAALPLAA